MCSLRHILELIKNGQYLLEVVDTFEPKLDIKYKHRYLYICDEFYHTP